MRIVQLEIFSSGAAGGILDGLSVNLPTPPDSDGSPLWTVCLVGRNGSGKSQLLQTLAEIFQDAWHTHAPEQERHEVNPDLVFELTYEMEFSEERTEIVRLSRRVGRARKGVVLEVLESSQWVTVAPETARFGDLLPPLVVGYTSGANETLSLPFFRSRAGYASEVGSAALLDNPSKVGVPDNRLILVDYGTNLEVLIANLMLGTDASAAQILEHANVQELLSWRCIVRLVPSTVKKTKPINGRRGVKLTSELEDILRRLGACSTCQSHDPVTDTYTFDFFVDQASRAAFGANWETAADLYRAFHKLALLNDLAIPRKTRNRLTRQIALGHFATRLPEPQDEEKVFRFEEVRFRSKADAGAPVDYVALSDGEHQQAQILGMLSMIEERNALFLLDEPESHFNPEWRTQFIKRLRGVAASGIGRQQVVLSSHAPFVASDMPRESVVILERNGGGVSARLPEFETFGARFDRILRDCFGVYPPISQVARDEINHLMSSGDAAEIEQGTKQLGGSVEKAMLLERLSRLQRKD
ncbi:restriction system-associated AAA family ATPase [Microbacterium paraoxydans]|uniref:restriction system-associated AAA family ATPase n=1 Tax=Microbacterium paraoxydans TaxID=199592 RepID=UPI003D74F270